MFENKAQNAEMITLHGADKSLKIKLKMLK
jgi:hypothetical protein